jgi:predicted ChrR family anti-sigma factor
MSDATRQPAGDPLEDLTPRELAELYAAGALTPAEASAFESRVRSADPAFVNALREVEPAMNTLLNSADPLTPPAGVRASIMARLNADTDQPATGEAVFEVHADEHDHAALPSPGVDAGITILRASTGRWTRTGLRGVRMRTLLADRKANRRTILLDMAAGSELPDHSHAGIEEVFMIRGDLSIAGEVLREGDYIRVERGANHGVPRTESGCVCIVISDYVPFPLTSLLGFVWAAARSLFGGPRKHG